LEMISRTFGIVVILFLIQSIVLGAGLYDKNSKVIQLNAKNFDQLVFNSDHVWIVEFYAPWCGHCKNLAPAWNKAAETLNGLVKVAAVNCDEDKEMAGRFGVQGFPTIKVFGSEKTVKNGKATKKAEDYQGARDADSIIKFAVSKLPNFIKQVNADNLDSFVSSALPKGLLFTNKDKTTDLYKGLAVEFKGRIEFGEVRVKETAVVEKFGVTEFPTLFFIPANGGEPVKYTDKLRIQTLIQFFGQYAGEKTEQTENESEQPKKEEPAVAVEIKDAETFESACLSKTLCVAFILDESSEDFAQHRKVIDAAVAKHGRQFHFVWLNGLKWPQVENTLNLQSGYPQLAMFNPKKKLAAVYPGAFEEKAISKFLDQAVRGGRSRIWFEVDALPSLK